MNGRFQKGALLAAALTLLVAGPAFSQAQSGSDAALKKRASELLKEMTLDEKIELIRAQTPDFMSTGAVPRLDIPAIITSDATQGARQSPNEGIRNGEPSTLFASVNLLASAWDEDLARCMGQGVANEAANKGLGARVLLGPGMNIHRSPLGGRNGEYFSEDPFLTGRLAAGYIRGAQNEGVAACAKHFVCNNQETDRSTVDVEVGERALREIYLRAFEMAVKDGGVWCIMDSYNRVRGRHASENEYLLTDVLRGDWGYDGCVMSDWGAVHHARAFAAGNDIDMHMGTDSGTKPEEMKTAIKNGEVSEADVDRAARNALVLALRAGVFDKHTPDPSAVNSAEHDALSLEIAHKGIVLLKNENHFLPLDARKIRSIALIGPGAEEMQLGAEGSPHVTPLHKTQLPEGIREVAGAGVKVSVLPTRVEAAAIPSSAVSGGEWKAEYFDNPSLQGRPVTVRDDAAIDFDWSGKGPAEGVGAAGFSVRWTGKIAAPETGAFLFDARTDDGCRLFIDGKPVIDRWVDKAADSATGVASLEKGRTYSLRFEYYQAQGDATASLRWVVPGSGMIEKVKQAARAADVVVFCASTKGDEEEGRDRASLNLPQGQDALIAAAVSANPRTVVVLNNGTPVDMRAWIAKTPAVVEAWFPGQRGGRAIADILFGKVNPSGKLTDTLGMRREDYCDFENYPGKDLTEHYDEGIYVGYRWFDKKGIAPLFPFGYGLSYTTFRYGNAKVSSPSLKPGGKVEVSVDVTNTGSVAGDEIVQLYVHDPHPKIDKPVRELKGFARVSLKPGETKTAVMTLDARDLAYCDVPGRQWKADAGAYELQIGASSRDIRETLPLALSEDFTEEIPHMAGAAK